MTAIDDAPFEAELEAYLARLVPDFTAKRHEKLVRLNAHDLLRRKNPYLLRAATNNTPRSVITMALDARVSSSEETVFGSDFMETLALWVAQRRPDKAIAFKSSAPGVDIEVHLDNVLRFYAVKSGPHVFNSQSRKKQADEFSALRSRLGNAKDKGIDTVVGYGYGSKRSSGTQFREVAGSAFWNEISDRPGMFELLLDSAAFDDLAAVERDAFSALREQKIDALVDQIDEYARADGTLDWTALSKSLWPESTTKG